MVTSVVAVTLTVDSDGVVLSTGWESAGTSGSVVLTTVGICCVRGDDMCERITKVYIHVLGYITDQNIIIFKIFLNYKKTCM